MNNRYNFKELKLKLLILLFLLSINEDSHSKESLTNDYTNVFRLDGEIYCFGNRNSVEVIRDGQLSSFYIKSESDFICWAKYKQYFLNIDLNHNLNILDETLNQIETLKLTDNSNDIIVTENDIYIFDYPSSLLKYNFEENSYLVQHFIPNFIIDKIIKVKDEQIFFMTKDRSLIIYDINQKSYKSHILDCNCSNFNYSFLDDDIYISSTNTIYNYNILNDELKSISVPETYNFIYPLDDRVLLLQNYIDSLVVDEVNFDELTKKNLRTFETKDKLKNIRFESYIESDNEVYIVGTKSFITSFSNEFKEIQHIRSVNSSGGRVTLNALSDNKLILNSSNRYTYSSIDGGSNWTSLSKRVVNNADYLYGYIIPFSIDNIYEFFPSSILFNYKKSIIEKLNKPYGLNFIADYGVAENNRNVGYLCSFQNYADANRGVFTKFDSDAVELVRLQKKDTLFQGYLNYNEKDYIVAGISSNSPMTGPNKFELFELDDENELNYISTISDSAHQSFEFFEKEDKFYLYIADNGYNYYILRSIDNGISWKRIDLDTNVSISDFNYSTVGNNFVVLKSFSRKVYFSTNLGDTWLELDTKQKNKDNIVGVEISENYIFITTDDTQIYRYRIDQQETNIEAEVENIPSVQIFDPFPNPSMNTVETKLYHTNSFDLNSIIVYDINGVALHKHNYSIVRHGTFTSSLIVNSDQIPPGTYIIYVESNGVTQSKKFIITK